MGYRVGHMSLLPVSDCPSFRGERAQSNNCRVQSTRSPRGRAQATTTTARVLFERRCTFPRPQLGQLDSNTITNHWWMLLQLALFFVIVNLITEGFGARESLGLLTTHINTEMRYAHFYCYNNTKPWSFITKERVFF